MSNASFTVYDGDKPYLFISYSHADEKVVFPLLQGIQEAGYRFWMDRGIEVGTEWSNNIADRLSHCEAVIFFVSKKSVQSENCLDEIACAKSHKKTAILIFLEEDVVLPGGVEMQTARFQRLYATRHSSLDSFMSALSAAPILQPCRELPPAPVAEPTTTPAPAPAPAPAQTVTCPRCGARLPVGSDFCATCGASLRAPAYAPPQPVPPPIPQPYTPPAPPAQPKKKLPKGGIIALAAVAVLLVVTIIVNVITAVDEERLYTVDEVVSAFEAAGYAMTYDTEGIDFTSDDITFVESTTSYMGTRTMGDLSDEVYFIYADCTGAETAKILYDIMVEEFGTYDEVSFGENWCRSVFYDEENGKVMYVSMHDDVVLLSGAEYYDYVLEERYYDNEIEYVLGKVNF